jgi:magnesium transporter
MPHFSPLATEHLQPDELADVIVNRPDEEKIELFNALVPERAAAVFEFMPFDVQQEILYSLSSERAAAVLNAMSPDDRTSLLAELPGTTATDLLKLLSPGERKVTLMLLGYPENSVGRLMTPNFIAVHLDWTVQQVLKHIRIWGYSSETIDYVYIVDDQRHLLDDVHIRAFLISSPHKRVSELSDGRYNALYATDDQEFALNTFRKNGRAALPVIDHNAVLLGIVTLDDILEISSEEFTEDIQKLGGVAALDQPYLKTPFLALMYKRAGWLVVLFIGELFTATALGYFEEEIASAVVLALFLPLIISSGGNAGSQASTLIIRALALDEISSRDWKTIGYREICSGLFLGTILGSVGFMRVSLWSFFSPIYGNHWPLIALTIFCSLIGVVLWGTLTGAMLPLILSRLGFDPATSSTPFVATLVDVTGLIIYFSIAIFFLRGTLL